MNEEPLNEAKRLVREHFRNVKNLKEADEVNWKLARELRNLKSTINIKNTK